ncbi:hypothetical protein E4T39_06975 [Aureobasidium subglaciale]|nr:hypothetical protein E4T39_06975 [Aureobasidium subglaciale]
MSTSASPSLALDVSTDDYATTAAQDQKAGIDATLAAVAQEAPLTDTIPAEVEDDSDAEREKAGAARAARMRYTEEDFLAQKESYVARIDEGNIWKQLVAFSPPFIPSEDFFSTVNAAPLSPSPSPTTPEAQAKKTEKTKLDKKHHQTIQAAVSELYFMEKYPAVQEIITWAKDNYEKDKKWDKQVQKWEDKCKEKMQVQQQA